MIDWPFDIDVDAPSGAYTVGPGWSVFDSSGKYLTSITTQPETGGLIALVNERDPVSVIAVYPDVLRVVVERT